MEPRHLTVLKRRQLRREAERLRHQILAFSRRIAREAPDELRPMLRAVAALRRIEEPELTPRAAADVITVRVSASRPRAEPELEARGGEFS